MLGSSRQVSKRLRFEVELFDGTGSLNAFIQEKEAEIILGMSTEQVIEADLQDRFSPHQLNEKLEDTKWLTHIRTTTFPMRREKVVRNTIIACILSTESTSTSTATQPENSASEPQLLQHSCKTNITMIEPEESISATQQQFSSTTPTTHPLNLRNKRSLDSTKDPPCKTSKHSKQD